MLPRTKISDITPLEFCRQIKSLELGISVERVAFREEHGTFKEYCRLLSRELGIPFSTINTRWGAGIEFPGMPARIRGMLKFVLAARVQELNSERMLTR